MRKLLHIIATPREDQSRPPQGRAVFFESLKKKNSDCLLDELIVTKKPLQSLTIKVVLGKYDLLGGQELDEQLKADWKKELQHI